MLEGAREVLDSQWICIARHLERRAFVRSVRAVFDRYRIFTENYFNGGNLEGPLNGQPSADPAAAPTPEAPR